MEWKNVSVFSGGECRRQNVFLFAVMQNSRLTVRQEYDSQEVWNSHRIVNISGADQLNNISAKLVVIVHKLIEEDRRDDDDGWY